MADGGPISNHQSLEIASSFILQAPPGELSEVIDDVRILLDDENILGKAALRSVACYNKDQFTPCRLEGSCHPVLITEHGDIGGGRFLDPRSKQTFSFDHSTRKPFDVRQVEIDGKMEDLRVAVESAITSYTNSHYLNGAVAVYSMHEDHKVYSGCGDCIVSSKSDKKTYSHSGRTENGVKSVMKSKKSDATHDRLNCGIENNMKVGPNLKEKLDIDCNENGENVGIKDKLGSDKKLKADDNVTLVVCIESHVCEAVNFVSGKWRGQWNVTLPMCGGGVANVSGLLRVHIHYFENGNVQLISSKVIDQDLKIEKFNADDLFVKLVSRAESAYQRALSKHLVNMSDNIFKSLRRQLPVTRSKIDWHKILGYKVGQELTKKVTNDKKQLLKNKAKASVELKRSGSSLEEEKNVKKEEECSVTTGMVFSF